MRIEKPQSIESTTRLNAQSRPTGASENKLSAEQPEVRKASGDIAGLVQELKSPRYDINRQALLQAVKKKLAAGDYHSPENAEKTASAILRYIDTRIPRSN